LIKVVEFPESREIVYIDNVHSYEVFVHGKLKTPGGKTLHDVVLIQSGRDGFVLLNNIGSTAKLDSTLDPNTYAGTPFVRLIEYQGIKYHILFLPLKNKAGLSLYEVFVVRDFDLKFIRIGLSRSSSYKLNKSGFLTVKSTVSEVDLRAMKAYRPANFNSPRHFISAVSSRPEFPNGSLLHIDENQNKIFYQDPEGRVRIIQEGKIYVKYDGPVNTDVLFLHTGNGFFFVNERGAIVKAPSKLDHNSVGPMLPITKRIDSDGVHYSMFFLPFKRNGRTFYEAYVVRAADLKILPCGVTRTAEITLDYGSVQIAKSLTRINLLTMRAMAPRNHASTIANPVISQFDILLDFTNGNQVLANSLSGRAYFYDASTSSYTALFVSHFTEVSGRNVSDLVFFRTADGYFFINEDGRISKIEIKLSAGKAAKGTKLEYFFFGEEKYLLIFFPYENAAGLKTYESFLVRISDLKVLALGNAASSTAFNLLNKGFLEVRGSKTRVDLETMEVHTLAGYLPVNDCRIFFDKVAL